MATSARGRVRSWMQRLWADVGASTDANVLGVLRFLGFLYGPIDTELPIDQAFRKALSNRVPRHANWRHAFGGITYLLFVLLVGTGVLLSFYYRPSAEEAYQSVQHIVSGISFGWLMRDLHSWCANLVVLAALVHMARVFFSETNWLVGLLLLLLIFAFGATGYLLPWDQWAYWTTTQGLEVVGHLPLIGGWVTTVLRGDPLVSGATLSRFFALHVIVLPWLALGLLMLHFQLLRKHGVAGPHGEDGAVVSPSTARDGAGGVPFFPNHLLRSISVAVLVIAVAITAAVVRPRNVAPPADASHPPAELYATWIVADVSRALFYYLGPWGFGAFLLLGVVLITLPLFDRAPERRLRRRPLVAGLGIAFFLGLAVAWAAGWQLRTAPSSAELAPLVTPADSSDSLPTASRPK